MHSLFGLLYQQTIQSLCEQGGCRSYHLVRNSGALAAPYASVLYSDLYNHQTYINAVAQSGFSGLLWTPEVRDAANEEDFLRRLQSVMCSPLAQVNAWYLMIPPWKQMNKAKNKERILDERWPELTAATKSWIEFRMRLVPYLHAAFVKYRDSGIPPFRALIMDFPAEAQAVKDIAGQYMMGDDIMVAPLVASGKDTTSKKIYFPSGFWYDFFTGERIEGGRSLTLEFPMERMPVYVREGTLLPLARPTLSTEDPQSRILDIRIYGETPHDAVVYEDDGRVSPRIKENVIRWDPRRKKVSLKSDFYRLGSTEVICQP